MPRNVTDDVSFVSGLDLLQSQTLGHPEVVIAVLDGPVDRTHACFQGARLQQLLSLVTPVVGQGMMAAHGTHVASVIFGQPNGPIRGIAPKCRGLIVPVFSDAASRPLQMDLARAIEQAVAEGAHIINISGGELSSPGAADPLLARAAERCRKNNVLLVAAAGNDGCACLHAPAAIPSVLAVGAANKDGQPLPSSNWGEAYRSHGILAPGQDILGAAPGGGTIAITGTSFATPLVTGVAALLLSLQIQMGLKPDPQAVREAILRSAIRCTPTASPDCQRFLTGRLHIPGAYALIQKGAKPSMSETIAEIATPQAITALSPEAGAISSSGQPGVSPSGPASTSTSTEPAAPSVPALAVAETHAVGVSPSAVTPSQACGCARKPSTPFVYAIGQLNYDFGTEARRDSFKQQMPYLKIGNQEFPPNPYDQKQMVDYLKGEEHENESTALIWVLNLELTPIYALDPVYPYSPKVYEFFRSALEGQIAPKDSDAYVSRISIPGTLTGRTVRLFSGQVVPVVEPQYRGMYAWNVNRLIEQAIKDANIPKDNGDKVRGILKEFLNRIYYDLRNLGSAPQDRALNYTATNAFQVVEVWNSVSAENRQLADMEVVKSPYCRMDSDCWDIKLIFFDPENDQRARKVYRFTIDVSDMMPVTIGEIRSWTEPAA